MVINFLPTEKEEPEMPETPEQSAARMKGWRTLAFNAGVAVVGVLATADWAGIGIPAQYSGPLVAAIGFINMYLRGVTDTPMGKK